MEVHTAGKAQEQAVAAVWCCDGEGWVLHECLHILHIAG